MELKLFPLEIGVDVSDSEKFSERTGNFLINALNRFLQKSPIEQIELIKNRIGFRENPLYPLIVQLIEDLKQFESTLPNNEKAFDRRIWEELDYILQVHFTDLLYFIVLQFLLDSTSTPLNKDYRKDLIKKHKLTPKKIQDNILSALGKNVFRNEIKHGGKEGFWNDQKKLELLANYNRFLIVIKNARKDLKTLVKKGKSELNAKKEVLTKYEIPETLIQSTFSNYDAPKETALDWAKQLMQIEFSEEYLRDILTKARILWNLRSKGIINKKTLEEYPKIQLILIDINFEIGCRYYAVTSLNKEKMNRLKYVTVAKKISGEFKISIEEEGKDFLALASF